MNKFGFKIAQTHSINVSESFPEEMNWTQIKVPSFKRCMSCGACTATCSAGNFTSFNIRKIHHLFSWGMYKEFEKDLQKCMLCGKCTLVCPRGVNLRSLIIYMRKNLDQIKKANQKSVL
jgi:Heterodisulfide reductase, subunit C